MTFALLFLLVAAFSEIASGQQVRGQITGRIVTANDNPVTGAVVIARPLTGDADTFPTPAASATTDASGVFTLSDLPPRLYQLGITAKGYATPGTPIRARLGDSPTIRLTRGGVITGKVTDRENRPIVEARVKVMRVADADGKPVTAPSPLFYPETMTDDRGEYRWWGLTPGNYLVWVEGAATRFLKLDPLEGDIPTYYPGTTRGGAKEVTVTEGGEATGIDLRHEGRRGFAISGRIAGVAEDTTVRLYLLDAETHVPVSQVIKDQVRGPEFTLSGIGPGTYDLVADGYQRKGGRVFADPIRVVMKNRDVEGLAVTLSPSSTVTGNITATPPEKALIEACGGEPTTSIEETSLQLVLKKENPVTQSSSPEGPLTVPAESGAFKLPGLRAGEYGLTVTPPAGWYVASATEPGTPKPKPLGSLLLKKGTSRENIAVTLEFGAATVKGTVSNLPKAAEDVEKLRVHLVPLDEAQVENTARYYETTVATDGGFELKNLAPGRYAVIVQKKDVPAGENPAFPVALDPAKRKLLRDAAKSAKTIELAPCRPGDGVTIEVKP
jgi:hypothetical protein